MLSFSCYSLKWRKHYNINNVTDIKKNYEILLDGCDISDMGESSSCVSTPGPSSLVPGSSNTVYEVPQEDYDTDAEEIIESRHESSETEQSDTDLSSNDEEDEEFYVSHKKKEKR